jgi:hypothetical protein
LTVHTLAERDGVLNPEAEQIQQKILEKYSELSALLRDHNTVCHDYLRTAKLNPRKPVPVLAIALTKEKGMEGIIAKRKDSIFDQASELPIG